MNRLFILLLFIPLFSACAGNGETPVSEQAGPPGQMALSSPAFAAGAAIPTVYSCQGEDRSPALEWSAPPAVTQSLALVVDDPDAPMKTWTHWIVYNLPPDTRGLAESASAANGPSTLRRARSAAKIPGAAKTMAALARPRASTAISFTCTRWMSPWTTRR
jgi:hypothetical protein